VVPEVHERLCEEKARWDERQGLQPAVPHYFPAYRRPCVPRQVSTASGRCP
jgi:hypothetical protein